MKLRISVAGAALSLALASAAAQGSTGSATVNECGSSSPQLIAMGDQYFHIDPFELSHSDTSHQVAFKDLRKGDGIRTECFPKGDGSGLEARQSIVELTDIVVVEKTDAVMIKAYEYNDKKKQLRLRNIAIPIVEDAAPVKTNTRRRQVTEVGSYLRETASSVSQTSDGLMVQQSIYVNGTLAEWLTWNLYN